MRVATQEELGERRKDDRIAGKQTSMKRDGQLLDRDAQICMGARGDNPARHSDLGNCERTKGSSDRYRQKEWHAMQAASLAATSSDAGSGAGDCASCVVSALTSLVAHCAQARVTRVLRSYEGVKWHVISRPPKSARRRRRERKGHADLKRVRCDCSCATAPSRGDGRVL